MKYKIVKISAISVLSLVAICNVQSVFADEIVIENNGSGGTTEVSVQSEVKTEVKQENTTNITNNVTVDANTGGNQANSNSGNTAIQTGDVNVDVSVANTGNINVANTNCNCPTDSGTVSVSGNGAKSNNTVNINNSTVNTASVENTANITNKIQGKAVTGNNQANANLGDVVIKTGSIHVAESIKNGPFNLSFVSLGVGKGGYVVNVNGNGAGSENYIFLSNLYTNNVKENNQFTIFNDTKWDLVTGNNQANKNNGDVTIKTGDIVYKSDITNTGNVNEVEIKCCEGKPEKPEKPETPPPSVGNGGGGNGGSSNGSSGSSNGVGGSIGDILPKTGGYLLYLLIASTLFLLFGAFMRLRAGRSPSFSFAI